MMHQPVREALKVLVAGGFVVSCAFDTSEVRIIGPQGARNIYAVRLLLEPEAVRLPVPRHDDESLRDCEEPLRHAEEADNDADIANMALFNRQFHRAVYAPCPNPLLSSLLNGIQDQVALISVSRWAHSASWHGEVIEHKAIVAAVIAGKGDLASSLLRVHVERFDNGVIEDRPSETTSQDQQGASSQ